MALASAAPRYALYFAPAATTPLWRFGCAAIGYDAETGHEVESLWQTRPALCQGLAGIDWRTATEDPRRYGFHGTLKAPFRLLPGYGVDDVLAATADLAASLAATDLGPLKVRKLERFVALLPVSGTGQALSALAMRCVEALEPLRAPLEPAELERRHKAGLSPAQTALLDRYGYPYVDDEFRFHMTLAGPVPAAVGDAVAAALDAIHGEMAGGATVILDQIAVFEQPGPNTRFRIIARFPLTG